MRMTSSFFSDSTGEQPIDMATVAYRKCLCEALWRGIESVSVFSVEKI